MLQQAMDAFQVAKREHKELVKAQYTDKQGPKDYFRASELGSGDRKIIYGFFAHQLPNRGKTPKNLRQLENGDYVHDRYQTAWEDMGILVSMEERLSSKDDEYLAQFPWEWAGHYDGELDVNIIRAHALGLCSVTSERNEDTGKWELVVDIDDAYAEKIGVFNDDYEPLVMIADIKTMNPWGFKRIKDKHDVSEIGGYFDQIMFYMYMKNTPYGSIYIEDKGSNDVVEIQILWTDIHEGVTYEWDETIHGEQTDNVVRVPLTSERFFGSDTYEGAVPRLNRLWDIKTKLEAMDASGDLSGMATIMVPRCSENPDKFPCSWGNGQEKCAFFDHCWGDHSYAVRKVESCPPEAIWEFDVNGDIVQVDNRKVPQGIDMNGFVQLVSLGALDYTKFLVDTPPASEDEEEKFIEPEVKRLFSPNGEINMEGFGSVAMPDSATEYTNEEGQKAIDCLACGKQVTYQRLGNGGTKKCNFCNHTNKVVKA